MFLSSLLVYFIPGVILAALIESKEEVKDEDLPTVYLLCALWPITVGLMIGKRR